MNNDVTDVLNSLSTYQTNKDQTLGSVIAKAASLLAREARCQSESETDSELACQYSPTSREKPDNKRT
jgi:hypothetical protein